MLQRFNYRRFARRWVPIAIVLAIAAGISSYFLTKRVLRPLYTATVKTEVRMGLPASGSALDPYYDNVFAQTQAEVASQSPYVTSALILAERTTGVHLSRSEFTAVHDSAGCSADQIAAVFSCSMSAHNARFAAVAANQWADDFIRSQALFDQARFQATLIGIQRDERAALRERDPTRYDTLVQRETSVQVAASQHSAEMRVVAPADPPTSPSSPHPSLNGGVAFAAVFLLVLVLGALVDTVDDSVRDEAELKAMSGLPIIGTIPYVRALKGKQASRRSLMISDDARSPAAESFRLLRTNLTFANVDNPPQILLVTSMRPEEGKSTVAANLATSFAESGKRVVLVDLDLHRPTIGRIFDVNGPGLSNLLVQGDNAHLGSYIFRAEYDTLGLLTTGPVPPVPDRLIGSNRLKGVLEQLRGVAEIVIVDSPPMLAVADAISLSAICDAVILVVRLNMVKRRSLRHAKESLESVHANVAGIVLNSVNVKSGKYGYGYGYKYSSKKPSEVQSTVEPPNEDETQRAV